MMSMTGSSITIRRKTREMSRLQEAVNKFAAEWLEVHGQKPSQDALMDGTFSRATGELFCLCFKNFTGIGSMINFSGLKCAGCGKPVTDDTYEWGSEARAERRDSR